MSNTTWSLRTSHTLGPEEKSAEMGWLEANGTKSTRRKVAEDWAAIMRLLEQVRGHHGDKSVWLPSCRWRLRGDTDSRTCPEEGIGQTVRAAGLQHPQSQTKRWWALK